jgi:hypothetical protein
MVVVEILSRQELTRVRGAALDAVEQTEVPRALDARGDHDQRATPRTSASCCATTRGVEALPKCVLFIWR